MREGTDTSIHPANVFFDIGALNNMDEAIGILNKAVDFLEIPKLEKTVTSKELEYPSKITWS